MRQIVIDTETTGLEPEKGHRIIEIGCVELLDRQLTGNTFHKYLNPEREVDPEAAAIHNLTNDFLRDKPLFNHILDEFLNFVSGAELIAHNASFDVGFINHEIKLVAKNRKSLESYVTVFDTLALARKKFPGQRNTLDAICKRYKIDLEERKRRGHGALLDAELLAKIYLLMTGGQGNLFADYEQEIFDTLHQTTSTLPTRGLLNKIATIVVPASKLELAAHEALLTTIKKSSNQCLWQKENEKPTE